MKYFVELFNEYHSINFGDSNVVEKEIKGEKVVFEQGRIMTMPTPDKTGSGFLKIKCRKREINDIYLIAKDWSHRDRIGQRIAKLRQERGLSVRALGELSGVTYQNVYKIEHGRYNVSIDILQKICNALDVEIALIDKAAE